MSEVIYVWSTDEERFVDNGCKTREDALADARQEHGVVEGTVWTGVQVPILVNNLARGWGFRILEGIADDLADEYGDLVDGMFSEVTKEQEKTLDDRIAELFAQWTKEIGFEPKFWGVADVQEHQVYAIEIGDIVSCDALGPEQRDATVIGQDTKTPGLRFVWSFDGMTFSNAFARTRSIAVKMGIQDRPWASKVWTGILDPSYVGHVVEIQEHDQPGFCFISFFNDKADWSRETFGPGDRYSGVIEHIRRELKEIEANPSDLTEWVDVIFLAMDGAWRSAGADGEAIVRKMLEKHKINRERRWPDWRSLGADGVSEHVKDEE